MDICPFCALSQDPSAVGRMLYEDALVFAYHAGLDQGPGYLGRLLLLPKRHALGFADLTEAEGQAIGLGITRLSKALTICTGAEKVYGEAYYEVHPHLHLILTARYPGTPQQYWRWHVSEWPEAPTGGPEAIAVLCEQLRTSLAQTAFESVQPEREPLLKGPVSMTNTVMNSHILALLHFARQQELALVAMLSEAERNATGTSDAWAAKDFLVNILCWKELQTQKLVAAQQGAIPPVWTDMDVVHQINHEAFARYQHNTFLEIEIQAEHVFRALVAQVGRMSEEELNNPSYYTWQEGDSLRGELLANGCWFPCHQLENCALQLGHPQCAFSLQGALLAELRQSMLPPEDIGGGLYNAACFYSLHGQPEQAIQLLPEAFHLKPTLLEWARHDADLDPLRADATFQVIFDDSELLALVPASKLISPQDLQASVRGNIPR